MGFLDVGTPLSWSESAGVRDYVKQHGLHQLLHIWSLNRDRHDGFLRWGEEVEYSLVDINSELSHSSVYAEAADVLEELTVREHIRPRPPTQLSSDWHPEFSNHMIEAIPSPPYPLNVNAILLLEPSMRLRRAKIQSILPPNKFVTSQTVFPRLGLDDFVSCMTSDISSTGAAAANEITQSVFVPDVLINPHPRFGTLVRNIRTRRGANPFITIPLFQDVETGVTATSRENDWSLAKPLGELNRFEVESLAKKTINPVKDQIYMDCFAFGMGMSCVQTTFACPDISSARYLYDQLAVLAPVFLALTASTPFQRGLLADYDTRWSTLEQAVDCRREDEMQTIPKSRYSGVSLYIADRGPLMTRKAEYNDSCPPINELAKTFLLEAGMDDVLAHHFAHLWVRDPMVIFAEKVELDDSRVVDHFENIQSTNWNSIRFKPPPPTESGAPGPIGWRVEFRTPEIQLTDFDNAAGVALISVLAQAIQAQELDFYIPMSMNDVNMRRSWQRDAITEQKFFFRRDVSNNAADRSIVELSLYEILKGGQGFRGIVNICEEFMRDAGKACNSQAAVKFAHYVDLLTERAAGRRMTCAQYLRRFVVTHPDYRHDSVVTPKISHDLTVLSTNIGFGVWAAPELHGNATGQLILQTPLPASTLLPRLSSEGASVLHCVEQPSSPSQIADAPSPSAGLTIIKKRMVVLNEIGNIYTMPVGVTTRFGTASRPDALADDPRGGGFFDIALSELLRRSQESSPSTADGGSAASPTGRKIEVAGGVQVSSEDFTRSWILKGIDCIGLNDGRSRSQDSVAKRCYVLKHLLKQNGSNTTLPPDFAEKAEVMFEGLSTICPSTSVECECEVGDDLIHELSRSLSLGFDTEEELEYFKQVCDASA